MKKGNLIRLFRLLNGLSQYDIAALYGVHQRNVQMIESARFGLRSDLVNSISHAFFISPQFYHFNEEPIFTSDVIFLTNADKMMKGAANDIIPLTHEFVKNYKIKKIFTVNKNTLVLNVNSQYIFIFTPTTANIVRRIQTEDITAKTISLDIDLSENDIERYYNFPFPKEKVADFIKSFFSAITTTPKFIFHKNEFLKQVAESKNFIIRRIKENKILEILEMMEFYKINFKDIESLEARWDSLEKQYFKNIGSESLERQMLKKFKSIILKKKKEAKG